MNESIDQHVATLLHDLVGFETLQRTYVEGTVRILGRMPKGNVKQLHTLNNHLLVAARDSGWTYDPSQFYLLPFPNSNEMRYLWRLVLAPDRIPLSADLLSQAFRSVRLDATQGPLTEIKLPGATANRNAPKNGKGAALLGQAVVGPAARGR